MPVAEAAQEPPDAHAVGPSALTQSFLGPLGDSVPDRRVLRSDHPLGPNRSTRTWFASTPRASRTSVAASANPAEPHTKYDVSVPSVSPSRSVTDSRPLGRP